MFEFMNKQMRKSQIESIDEAIEKNYEFHIWYCTKKENCGKSSFCHETCGFEDK
jgi:hypothetical protein